MAMSGPCVLVRRFRRELLQVQDGTMDAAAFSRQVILALTFGKGADYFPQGAFDRLYFLAGHYPALAALAPPSHLSEEAGQFVPTAREQLMALFDYIERESEEGDTYEIETRRAAARKAQKEVHEADDLLPMPDPPADHDLAAPAEAELRAEARVQAGRVAAAVGGGARFQAKLASRLADHLYRRVTSYSLRDLQVDEALLETEDDDWLHMMAGALMDIAQEVVEQADRR